MAGHEIFVYSMSPEQIKSEPESEDEMEVSCRLCNKVFASCVALQNHAKIVHINAYSTGDPKEWTDDTKLESPKKAKIPKIEPEDMAKAAEIISSIGPTNVAFSAKEVSYIVMKTNELQTTTRKRKRPKKETKAKPVLKKEPEVITGPFECLEASTFGSDGTCHQMFFSCCEYSEHQLSEHTRPRRRAARCQVCERPLSQLHQTGPKDFTCEQCLEGFDNVGDLIEHKNMFHYQKKRFECSVCQKKFSAQGGVVQHMRMHTGDRPYSCTFCPKAFTQKSGLEQHVRIHTKVKPFRCVICSKSFIQTVHLRQHMRTHTNVAPFQCVICEKRFKQSSHLNYHLKNHPANMTDEQKRKYRQIVSNHQRTDQEAMEAHAKQIIAGVDGTGDEIEETSYEVGGTGEEIEENGEEIEENCEEIEENEENGEEIEENGEEIEENGEEIEENGEEIEENGEEIEENGEQFEENGDEGTSYEVEETGNEVEGISDEVDGIGEEVDEADYEVYEAQEENYPNVIACEVVQYED